MKKVVTIIILCLIATWPFFKKGYFESHDGEWMVIRFSAFHQTLRDGQFPVRFVDRLNNNYGYPVLNFLYPLPFYLAEIPKVLGFGFVDSIKIVFVISTVTSALVAYWAFSQVFSVYASLAGAILYLFIPYRFVDLYVRGSLGENLAFAIIPLILGCIFKIARGERIFLAVLAISVSLLIVSHNVIAILFLPLFIIISLILIKKKKEVTLAFVLGILVSTFFWLPAIYDLQYVRLSQIKVSNIQDHLVGPLQLIIPSWGYGPSPNGQNPLPVQIGIVALASFVFAFYLRFANKIKDLLLDLMLLVFILVFFLITKISLLFWQNVPFADIIQFPWRMLSILVFISSFLIAYVVNANKKQIVLAVIIVLASIISTIVYTKPAVFVDRGDGFYSTNEDSTTVRDEYLPLWVQDKPASRANQKIEIINGDAQINQSLIRPAVYQATITALTDSKIQINTIYFPGWQVKVDSQNVPISYQNRYGLITFDLPAGEHKVIINYARSPVHLISEIISLMALVATGIFFYSLWRKQNS